MVHARVVKTKRRGGRRREGEEEGATGEAARRPFQHVKAWLPPAG